MLKWNILLFLRDVFFVNVTILHKVFLIKKIQNFNN